MRAFIQAILQLRTQLEDAREEGTRRFVALAESSARILTMANEEIYKREGKLDAMCQYVNGMVLNARAFTSKIMGY